MGELWQETVLLEKGQSDDEAVKDGSEGSIKHNLDTKLKFNILIERGRKREEERIGHRMRPFHQFNR